MREVRRVLLLNPPSVRRPMLRDSQCSGSSKGAYVWAPIDLLVLSGHLHGPFEVSVLDATAEGLSVAVATERALASRPDAVVSLVGGASFEADGRFLAEIAARTGALMVLSGDLAVFESALTMARWPWADALLSDFASAEVVRLLQGATDVCGITLRTADGIAHTPLRSRETCWPRPRHERFDLSRYSLPFSRHARPRTTSVMASFGCPHTCGYCAFGELPLRLRPIEDLCEEMGWLAERGVTDVFIRDLTFGPGLRRAKEVCQRLAAQGPIPDWICEARPDQMDDELVGLMRAAGCRLVMLGVDAGTDQRLSEEGRRTTVAATTEAFERCDRLGLPTLGHFVLGLPGDDRESVRQTLALSRTLPMHHASFNSYVPRLGTRDRAELIAAGRLRADDLQGLDSAAAPIRSFCSLGVAELRRARLAAFAGFYGRPRQLLRVARHSHPRRLLRDGGRVLGALLGTR